MDLHGLTIASSNRHLPDSFVGRVIRFSPLFPASFQGAAGNYYALGVTSKKMGHYASFPVRDHAGKIVGVAVIKSTLDEIETLIHENYLALVIDQQGIVVMSNQSDMVLRSLWPLAETVKEELIASRQFGDGPFTPILNQKPVDGVNTFSRGNTYGPAPAGPLGRLVHCHLWLHVRPSPRLVFLALALPCSLVWH